MHLYFSIVLILHWTMLPRGFYQRSFALHISIHSSRVGRYSNTARKPVVIFLQYCQKFSVFPYLLPKTLKFPRTGREKRFPCRRESPTVFMRAYGSHHNNTCYLYRLLLSYCITSFVCHAFTMPKRRQSDIFA